VVYASTSPALAVLEILVHYSVLPRDFVLTPIKVPRGVLIEEVPAEHLPSHWNSPSPVKATREFGRRWANEKRSAVLSVPSSIVPVDRNFLINPLHPDFRRIVFLPPEPFYFDQRLK
jgi:RES domain-containing protein